MNNGTEAMPERYDEHMDRFVRECRKAGLRITPQRMAVYEALLASEDHPSAEALHRRVSQKMPNISLDTVNRTVHTLTEIGVAFALEGSGDAMRFDAGLHRHQHFRCVKCRRIIDFHYEPFDNIELPDDVCGDCTVLRKTVYVEGLCGTCSHNVD